MRFFILFSILLLSVTGNTSTLNTEEELIILNEKYKDTEVPCDYKITTWMVFEDNSLVAHSKSFNKHVYTNADFRDLPDTRYEFEIHMKMEIAGGYSKNDFVTVRYQKSGEDFKTNWFSNGQLSKQEIDEIDWNGGSFSKPYSEGKCYIKKITILTEEDAKYLYEG